MIPHLVKEVGEAISLEENISNRKLSSFSSYCYCFVYCYFFSF